MATIGLRKPLARKWLSLTYVIAWVTIACAMSAAQASGAPTGPELRAAVIVAILRFTSWPSVVAESDTSYVRLCAVGEPHSSSYLLPASGVQKVAGHMLVVDEVQADEVATKPCNALVIGSKVNHREFSELLAQADAQSLLTICDGCRSANAAGTIIQLDLHKRRVKFEVNLARARASGVKLDAQLLELASVVRK